MAAAIAQGLPHGRVAPRKVDVLGCEAALGEVLRYGTPSGNRFVGTTAGIDNAPRISCCLMGVTMVSKNNRPEAEIVARIRAVTASDERSFRGLLQAGGFDLSKDLRFQNLSGLSFMGQDLRGVDFTGANLIGCNFKNARVMGSRFERARLGNIRFGYDQDISLWRSADWDEYATTWIGGDLDDNPAKPTDDHLAEGDLFIDSPQLPLMLSLQTGVRTKKNPHGERIAISRDLISPNLEALLLDSHELRTAATRALYAFAPQTPSAWGVSYRYIEWASKHARQRYRVLCTDEWSGIFDVGGRLHDSARHVLPSLPDESKWEWCVRSSDSDEPVSRQLGFAQPHGMKTLGCLRLVRYLNLRIPLR